MGLGLKQEGKTDEANGDAAVASRRYAADAPWREPLVQALADIGRKPPALTSEQMAAGAEMTPDRAGTP